MAWEENKHPRDKSGQFTSKGNENRGGSNEQYSDEDIMMEVADGDYYYGDLDNEQDIYNLVAKRLNISPERAKQALKNQGFDFKEYKKYINGEDFDVEDDDFEKWDWDEDFVENVDNIDYNKVDKNESINRNKAKNPNRKDKYGNELISDEAFRVGVAGVNKYLDFMKQYYDYDKLKQSNIFLEGLQNAASKAITENGYNPNSDMTNQDFNEIVGAALGDEIDIERNRFTGKKYNGYKPKGL